MKLGASLIVTAGIGVLLATDPGFGETIGRKDPSPFETLRLEISGMVNTNRNQFHRFWDPRLGAELAGETPFYLGVAQAGIHLYAFSGRESSIPDFESRYTFIGWGEDWEVRPRLHGAVIARVGVMWMNFDDDTLPGPARNENELGYSFVGRVSYRFGSSWFLTGSARYRRIYTDTRLEHFFLGGGIAYELETPGWLRDFLK